MYTRWAWLPRARRSTNDARSKVCWEGSAYTLLLTQFGMTLSNTPACQRLRGHERQQRRAKPGHSLWRRTIRKTLRQQQREDEVPPAPGCPGGGRRWRSGESSQANSRPSAPPDPACPRAQADRPPAPSTMPPAYKTASSAVKAVVTEPGMPEPGPYPSPGRPAGSRGLQRLRERQAAGWKT